MDLLTDIKEYLVANGVTAFIGRDHMPDKPDVAMALYEYDGALPLPQIAGATRMVQVIGRSDNPAEAHKLCSVALKLLRTEDSIIQLTTDRWSTISIRQVPFKFKTDEAGRAYYCFNAVFTTYIE